MKLVEQILKFIKDLDWTTISETIIASVILSAGVVIWKIIKKYRKVEPWKENERISKLSGFSDDNYLTVVNSSLYIPISGQKEAPNNNIELVASENRFILEDMLLKKFFSTRKSIEKKRYLILGGSGMGKTIFTISFFNKFINWYKFKINPYPIYVKYLGNKSVLDEINSIDDPKISQSIILLDALEDNRDASDDLDSFMERLEEVTRKFKYVIITCRTQFFAKESLELNESSLWINGSNKRALSYEKIYLSPFTEQEISEYLDNKYRVGSLNYRKALSISKKYRDLASRPLILSFMDDLLELEKLEDLNIVDIYSTIVNAWFQRECEIEPYDKTELWNFSKKIAYLIYTKWADCGEQFLSEDEYLHFIEENGYKESPFSFNVRSLINRTNDGSIKFSHRSFWEFFLAIYSIENPGLSFNPKGLDLALKFSKEMYDSVLSESPYAFLNLPKSHYNCIDSIFTPEFKNELEVIYNKITKAANSNSKKNESDLIDMYIYQYLEILTLKMPQFFFNFHRFQVISDGISIEHNGYFPTIAFETIAKNSVYLDCYKDLLHSFLDNESCTFIIIFN